MNNPKTPTWYGCSPSSVGVGGEPNPQSTLGCLASSQSGAPYWGRMDYFSIAMDTNETAWAGFNQECPGGFPFPGVPNNCKGAMGQPQDSMWSMVGRLVGTKGNDNDNDNAQD